MLIQALASTPLDIIRLVRPLDTAAAAWRTAPDSWSCRDVVNHLCYVEPLYLARLHRIMTEGEPTVPYIDPGRAPEIPDTPITELVERFRTEREATLTALRELPPGGWQRAAIHERKGRMTLRYLVQDLVSHDIEHTSQLVEIQGRWRASLKLQRGPGQPGSGR